MSTQPKTNTAPDLLEPGNTAQNVLLKMTSDSRSSRVTCSLLTEAFGLSAGTEVALSVKGREQELWHFREGAKHGNDTLGQNVVVVAKACFLRKNTSDSRYPELATHSLHVADPNWSQQESSSRYSTGFVHAGEGRVIDLNDDTYKLVENRSVVFNDEASEAFTFSGVEDFIMKSTEWLKAAGQKGTLMVRQTNVTEVLRGTNPDEETSVRPLRITWGSKEDRILSIEESIKLFLDGDSNNPSWRNIIALSGRSDNQKLFFDAIPVRHAPTKIVYTDSYECYRNLDISRHEGRNYQFKATRNEVERLFAKGVIVYENIGKRGMNGNEASTSVYPIDPFGPLYKISELPGCRTSDVQAVFDARATKRGIRSEFAKDTTHEKSAINSQNEQSEAPDIPNRSLRDKIIGWKSKALDKDATAETPHESGPKLGF